MKLYDTSIYGDSLVAQTIENPPSTQETWVQSLGWEDDLEREWQPTPVFLPGDSYGQRSLAGFSPQGFKKSDTAERLDTHMNTLIHCQILQLCEMYSLKKFLYIDMYLFDP